MVLPAPILLQHKTALLVHLLKQPEATRSIVFVRKRERVHELANWLREAGINNCYLEGEMVQGKRNEAIKRLTEGRVNVLVATDVAARGIDIPDVSHVFNFDMPRSGDTYLHRIGRTARAGRKGTAISLVEAHDHLLLGKVGRYIEEPIKARVIDELRPKTRAPSEKQTGKPSKKVLAKRAEKKKAKEKEKPRVKKRHRDTKNIGKRRKPSGTGVPPQTTEELILIPGLSPELKVLANAKLPDALRLSGLHGSCNILNLHDLVGRIRRSELHPKCWT